ncbi:MAG: hypothetical protein ACETWD_01220, partial [Desulfatiglandales bacterium]
CRLVSLCTVVVESEETVIFRTKKEDSVMSLRNTPELQKELSLLAMYLLDEAHSTAPNSKTLQLIADKLVKLIAEPYVSYNLMRDKKGMMQIMTRLDWFQMREIAGPLKEGKKIEAIKAFRAATNCGLREAKEFIDLFTVANPGTAFHRTWLMVIGKEIDEQETDDSDHDQTGR